MSTSIEHFANIELAIIVVGIIGMVLICYMACDGIKKGVTK